ncbi:MAG: Hsp20/alpha crystallin family protein [Ruminiclostridium sp.]|nr:Hsp20/alpha crystallin family protein [Ruminiclostridium sp.]
MFGLTPYNKRGTGLLGGHDLFDMRSIFDSFFEDPFRSAFFSTVNPMKADIRETEKEYIIDAELPGIKKEDIRLDLRDDTLTVSVEHNEQVNEEKDNYIRRERRFGSFSRSFYVENVRHEDVSAKYNDGILTVSIPKAEAGKERNRKIDIQ